MQYIPWLLQSLKQYQTSTGTQLLNMLTLHYYPEQGEFSNDDSAGMQAIRNRSTRSLWDPNYTDTSWIASNVMLIPRMKNWVSTYYPGLQTGITEYNWGDEGAMNGATTQADIYGIFGREGLDLASRWTTPATNSPAYLSMKIYRNYDGKNSTFGDTSVECDAPNADSVSAFAAQRSSDGAVTVMLINKQTTASQVQLNLTGLANQVMSSVWQLAPASTPAITQLSGGPVSGAGFSVSLPAQSVTLYVLSSLDNVTHLSLSPGTIAGGQTTTGTITLGSAAPTGGFTVDLASSLGTYASVPANATVPAGSTTTTFPVTTVAYSRTLDFTISASAGSSEKTAALVTLGDSVSKLVLTPSTVNGGQASAGTLTLSSPAPAGGWTVNLASSLSAYASVPASVTVPAGSTSGTFSVTTVAYSRALSFTITASDKVSKKTASLTTEGDSVSALSLSPSTVTGGQASTGTVTLSSPAPAGGWTVNLASSLSKYASVPASITVPAGSISATFAVSTVAYSRALTFTITAADAVSKKTATLVVNP